MRRPSLHKSTIIVVAFATVVALITEIPGRVVGGSTGSEPRLVFEHGWPWVYLRRETVDRYIAEARPDGLSLIPSYSYARIDIRSDLPREGIPWLTAANWRFWDVDELADPPHWEFRGWIALVDIAATALVLLLAVAAWEVRRRRCPGLLSFGLGDLFVSITLVSAVFGWLAYQNRESRRDTQLLREVRQYISTDFVWGNGNYECVVPLWLQSLVGPRWLPAYAWRVKGVLVYALGVPETDFIRLRELSHLKQIQITDNEPTFNLSIVRSLPRVTTLDITGWPSSDEENYEHVMQLKQLRVLIVDKKDLGQNLLSRLQSALPHCKIIDSNDDW